MPVGELLYHDTHGSTFSGCARDSSEYLSKDVEDCNEEPGDFLQVFRIVFELCMQRNSETVLNLFPDSGKPRQSSENLCGCQTSRAFFACYSNTGRTCTGVGAVVIEKNICAAFLGLWSSHLSRHMAESLAEQYVKVSLVTSLETLVALILPLFLF